MRQITALTGEDLTPNPCGHHCPSDCPRCGEPDYVHCDECGAGFAEGLEAEDNLVTLECGGQICVKCLTVFTS